MNTQAIPFSFDRSEWTKSLYDSLLLILEVLLLFYKMIVSGFESIIKLLIPPYEKSLVGEIILITGTGHGIGRELVLQLATEGCTIIAWDINEDGNAETHKMLKEKGLEDRVHFYKCDVTIRENVLNLANKVEKEVGQVTIVINNAGIMHCKPLDKLTHHIIEKTFQVNVLAHFWILEAFLPNMRQRNSGHIVAICSMCGIMGLPYAVPYSASKFAVRGMMEAMAEEYRLHDETSGIKFTTIYPITVNTGLAKKPKNRFPILLNVLQPNSVAADIIKAVKRENYEIALPTFLLTFDRINRLLPQKLVQHARDFLDTGVYPE